MPRELNICNAIAALLKCLNRASPGNVEYLLNVFVTVNISEMNKKSNIQINCRIEILKRFLIDKPVEKVHRWFCDFQNYYDERSELENYVNFNRTQLKQAIPDRFDYEAKRIFPAVFSCFAFNQFVLRFVFIQTLNFKVCAVHSKIFVFVAYFNWIGWRKK